MYAKFFEDLNCCQPFWQEFDLSSGVGNYGVLPLLESDTVVNLRNLCKLSKPERGLKNRRQRVLQAAGYREASDNGLRTFASRTFASRNLFARISRFEDLALISLLSQTIIFHILFCELKLARNPLHIRRSRRVNHGPLMERLVYDTQRRKLTKTMLELRRTEGTMRPMGKRIACLFLLVYFISSN
jgi:hypothetical protein